MRIKIDRHFIDVDIAKTQEEISIGMTKYKFPQKRGILFDLKGRYSILTMKDMKFPLFAWFLDDKGNIFKRGILEVGQKYVMPSYNGRYAYTMIEYPLEYISNG